MSPAVHRQSSPQSPRNTPLGIRVDPAARRAVSSDVRPTREHHARLVPTRLPCRNRADAMFDRVREPRCSCCGLPVENRPGMLHVRSLSVTGIAHQYVSLTHRNCTSSASVNSGRFVLRFNHDESLIFLRHRQVLLASRRPVNFQTHNMLGSRESPERTTV